MIFFQQTGNCVSLHLIFPDMVYGILMLNRTYSSGLIVLDFVDSICQRIQMLNEILNLLV